MVAEETPGIEDNWASTASVPFSSGISVLTWTDLRPKAIGFSVIEILLPPKALMRISASCLIASRLVSGASGMSLVMITTIGGIPA